MRQSLRHRARWRHWQRYRALHELWRQETVNIKDSPRTAMRRFPAWVLAWMHTP
jgi:hypothetical protein